MMRNLSKFMVSVCNEDLQDLHKRLELTRWPDEVAGAKSDYGIPLGFMKEITHYWKNEFDWRKVEKRINSYSNYMVEIDGVDVHFIHERGNGSNPLPIIIPHGWPSSFYEMLDLIPYLTTPEKHGGNPEDSFDVIIPSIPGHGFSGIPLEPGFEDRKVADLLTKLMKGLGYEKFGAHGYDLGASILGLLCLDHPERIIGYHTTSPGNPSPFISKDTDLTENEQEFLAYSKKWYSDEGGYAHILGTRPQTVAYGLNDSPVGLAAFILEKWSAWTTVPGGNVLNHFNKDNLLANVSIYWFTRTINAANRYYYEGKHTNWPGPGDISQIPHGVSLTATQPFERPPREYVERLFPNIISWEELNTGGHFVALEQPKLIAEQIRRFFRRLR
jgi:pimeloyl-ACP methyl ester carboxylesterase